MKKIMTLAAMFAAAMLTFSSCEKTGDDNNKGNNEQTPGGENTPGGEDEYESPITIDGDFSDWAALEASKVAVTTCAENPYKDALKVLKVYADEVYINVYFEFDPDQVVFETDYVTSQTNSEGEPYENIVPFHVYIDADGPGAGGFNQWSDQCVDILTEGAIMENKEFVSFSSGAFFWNPAVAPEEWGWIPGVADVMATGMGSGNKYELAFMVEMLGAQFGDTFGIGADIQDYTWNSVGILPNVDVTEENTAGRSTMLQVSFDK